MRAAQLGFWWQTLGAPAPAREPLGGPLEVDVAIVGAGYTGLWSAYYLKRAAPHLRIAVLERHVAGYGASGRNGGWVSGFFAGAARRYEQRSGSRALDALQREMFATVEEVGAFLREHDVQADYVKSGQLGVAIGRAQAARQRELLRAARGRGIGEEDLRALSARELSDRVHVQGACAATFTPHVARVHPARLVRGLADAVASLGVQIYEHTPVLLIGPHLAETPAGAVQARWVVRATEGYTASLRGQRRALAPVNSSMIVTEPLAAQAWSQIGWSGQELLADEAHVYVYLQRTADGRIAIGGRGVPYRFGSRTGGGGGTPARTVTALHAKLVEMFPPARELELAHAWSGVLGVARDWCVSVGADRVRGLAWAGGYVGEGVAASNLAARTLRDLLLGQDSALTRMPWVAARPPRNWEPEPLRWAAIRGTYALYRLADRGERLTGRPSRGAALLDALSGRS
ncbi:MAG TPA: FAD-binding oxidoreductase [Solirubrobacteraceae bacterium]|nr:FAD-binding oxidoreductase [Solirubrobacteraceae bacterium]